MACQDVSCGELANIYYEILYPGGHKTEVCSPAIRSIKENMTVEEHG